MKSSSDLEMKILVDDGLAEHEGFRPHTRSGSLVMQRLDEAIGGWSETISQASALAESAIQVTSTSDAIEIEEITIGLTLTAEGGLAFLAKAGAQGTIQVKFKRRRTG